MKVTLPDGSPLELPDGARVRDALASGRAALWDDRARENAAYFVEKDGRALTGVVQDPVGELRELLDLRGDDHHVGCHLDLRRDHHDESGDDHLRRRRVLLVGSNQLTWWRLVHPAWRWGAAIHRWRRQPADAVRRHCLARPRGSEPGCRHPSTPSRLASPAAPRIPRYALSPEPRQGWWLRRTTLARLGAV